MMSHHTHHTLQTKGGMTIASLLVVVTMYLVSAATAFVGPSCASIGGSCAASCSSGMPYRTTDCFATASTPTCCIALTDPGVGAGYLNSEAITKLRANPSTCVSRTTGCISLTGIHTVLADSVAEVFSSSCTVQITQGTEVVASRAGVAGQCGAVSGRRVAFTVSATCGSNAVSRMTRDPTTGCYMYQGTSFCQTLGFSTFTTWTAWFCATLNPGPGLWMDVLSNPNINWNVGLALDNAVSASLGDRAVTSNGVSVTLDGRVALSLMRGSYTQITVEHLSSGQQPTNSRQNVGRAFTVTTGAYGVQYFCGDFECRKPQVTQGGTTEFSWLEPKQTLTSTQESVDCSYIDYTSIYSAMSTQCFSNDYILSLVDTTDPCAMFASAAFWSAIFSCVRTNNVRDWKCFWTPAYSTACTYYYNYGYFSSSDTTPICGSVTMSQLLSNMCQGFANSAGIITIRKVGTTTERQFDPAGTMLADVSAATNVNINWRSDDANQVTGRTTDGDTAAAADDVKSSITVFENQGPVEVTVTNPSGVEETSGAGRAQISGAVLLGVLAIGALGASAGVVVVKLMSTTRYDAWVAIFVKRSILLACTALGLLVVAAAGANWAQTEQKANSYKTISSLGACTCSALDKVCAAGAVGGMYASAAFTILYMIVLLCLIVLLHVVAAGSDVAKGRFFMFVHNPIGKFLKWGLLGATVLFATLSFAIFLGSSNTCTVQTIAGLSIVKLGPGVILRIIEFVLLLFLSGALALGFMQRFAMDKDVEARRVLCVLWVIAPMALASSSSMSWTIVLGSSHLSPFTACSCRSWPCKTTLGAHQAAYALMWCALSLLAGYVAYRHWWPSALVTAAADPIRERLPEKVLQLLNRIKISARVQWMIGLILIGASAVLLGLSLVIHLAVLIAAECHMEVYATSYGTVFTVLAFVLMVLHSTTEFLVGPLSDYVVEAIPTGLQPKIDVARDQETFEATTTTLGDTTTPTKGSPNMLPE